MKYKKKVITFIFCIIIGIGCLLTACNHTLSENKSLQSNNENNSLHGTTDADRPIENYVSKAGGLQYYNGYLYLFDSCRGSVSTLIRYNPETSNITTVCPDPLCTHEDIEMCPFAGFITNFFILDNTIYYKRSFTVPTKRSDGKYDFNYYRQYCAYDISSMKLNILREVDHADQDTDTGRHLIHNGYWYYYDLAYQENTETYQWMIARMDLKNGKVTYLNEGRDASGDHKSYLHQEQFLFAVGTRIYFSDPESIYSTDENLQDKQIHVRGRFGDHNNIYTDGQYIYYGQTIPYNPEKPETFNCLELYRVPLHGGEIEELGVHASTGHWFLTEQYIYYLTPYFVKVPYSPEDPEVGASNPCDAVWRCHRDGSNPENIMNLYQYHDDNRELPYLTMKLSNLTFVGEYLFATYGVWEDLDNNGLFGDTESYVMIDRPKDKDMKLLRIHPDSGTYDFVTIREAEK